ncbi:MAG: hypothetical protein ACOC5M_00145 [Chloroflexota bacterium]
MTTTQRGHSMSIEDKFEQIENLIVNGRVPGTSRALVNIERFVEMLHAMRVSLPEEVTEAQAILRQKEGVLKQAEIEARRIRAYADEEATTIRQTAEEKAAQATESATEQANRMVQDTEVAQAAQERAKEIIAQAERDANAKIQAAQKRVDSIIHDAEAEADKRRQGADAYAKEVLFGLEEHVSGVLGKVRSGLDILESQTEGNNGNSKGLPASGNGRSANGKSRSSGR